MVSPNYVLIGCQKGGTTSALVHFKQNPGVFMAGRELHYFDRDEKYKKNNYEKNFKTNRKMVGEKTPSYCYIPKAINRLHKYNPNMKLILFIREPVSRAFSEYNMWKYAGGRSKNKRIPKNTTFWETIERDLNVKIDNIKSNGYYALPRGYYMDQIEMILSKFPRKNLHITISEEMYANPLKEYNKIFEFLGVRTLNENEFKFYPDVHKGKYKETISEEDFKKLYAIYKPYNDRLYSFLGGSIESWENKYRKYGL